jgi:hypothetical protein
MNSHPNISKGSGCLFEAIIAEIYLIWLKSEHGISWSLEKLIISESYSDIREAPSPVLVFNTLVLTARLSAIYSVAGQIPESGWKREV